MELTEARSIRLRKTHKRQWLWRTVSGVLIGLALVFLLLLGWFSPVYIADPSMEPTLKAGETVLYDRMYKHFYKLRRGDMVAFRDPDSGELLIKRIAALPGETVSAEGGVILIDGQYALYENEYFTPAAFDLQPVKVPEGSLFVLSDDRNYGEDSRNSAIGCIAAADVLGVVRVRLDRFTFFKNGGR